MWWRVYSPGPLRRRTAHYMHAMHMQTDRTYIHIWCDSIKNAIQAARTWTRVWVGMICWTLGMDNLAPDARISRIGSFCSVVLDLDAYFVHTQSAHFQCFSRFFVRGRFRDVYTWIYIPYRVHSGKRKKSGGAVSLTNKWRIVENDNSTVFGKPKPERIFPELSRFQRCVCCKLPTPRMLWMPSGDSG